MPAAAADLLFGLLQRLRGFGGRGVGRFKAVVQFFIVIVHRSVLLVSLVQKKIGGKLQHVAYALEREPAAHVRVEAEADADEVGILADLLDRRLAARLPHGGKTGLVGRHGPHDLPDLGPAGFDAAGVDAVGDGVGGY